MQRRNEEAFKHERAAFEADMAAARAAIEAGDLSRAVDLVVSPSHEFWYGKERLRFELFHDLYKLIGDPIDESIYRENPWQAKLLAKLYSIWPKLSLESAILRHNFAEPQTNPWKVSGAAAVQLAKYRSGFLATRWGALSQGRFRLTFWDLERGEVIHTREAELELRTSFIGREGSTVLFAEAWREPETRELRWSTSFRETFRRISSSRWAQATRYYRVAGEVVSVDRESTIEVDRRAYEASPVQGEVLRPREFKPQTPRYLEYLREVYSAEEVEEILEKNRRERQREKEIVRIRRPQTLTLAHEAIEGYLPTQTTTFIAQDGYEEPKVSELWTGRITATVGVAGDEAWLENIIAPGHGLKGMYGISATTPITALCISSDGALGLRNGNGETFGMWNLWTGDRLREFEGHTDRVTCLGLSVDVSYAVSGSEDKTVRLWKPIDAECVRVFEGHEDTVSKVCISLDATKILSADRGGVIKLWDIASGECVRTIQAHSDNVSGLLITFDGKFAVSGSWDKTVRLWDLTDGACLKTFEHFDWVTSVDMTPDCRYLVSSSYEGTKVWELLWRLEPRAVAEWDEGARRYLEILMNANAAWDGKLSTPVDMTEEEKKNSLRRQGPSWIAWHAPSKKNDWHRVWHLNWDIEETIGYAGYGWLSGIGEESKKIQEEWERKNSPAEIDGNGVD